MYLEAFAALFMAAAINSALPGPCVIAVAGRTLREGWRSGASLCLGVFLGDAILIGAALGSMAGLVALSPIWLEALRYGAIAVPIGFACLALRPRPTVPVPECRPRRRTLAAGMALGMSSPFNLVFYLAMLPHAIGSIALDPAQALRLVPCLAIGLTALAGIAVAQIATVCLAAQLRRGPVRGRWVDYGTAALMLGVATAGALTTLPGAGPPVRERAAGEVWAYR